MNQYAQKPSKKKLYFSLIILLLAFVLLGVGYHFWSIRPYNIKDVGGEGVDLKALEALNNIRKDTGRRWKITSGYRSEQHNQRVGGASSSLHIKGLAFDVAVPMKYRQHFYIAAKNYGFTGFGWGNNIVHIDMGPKRWWTYDNKGKALSAGEKEKYLHKAPQGFLSDYGLEINSSENQ